MSTFGRCFAILIIAASFARAIGHTTPLVPEGHSRAGAAVTASTNDGGDDSNRTIVFTTTPPAAALINEPFTYEAGVSTDPAGLPVCFRLKDGPDGMTIDSGGVVHWLPAAAGMFEVEIEARLCGSGGGGVAADDGGDGGGGGNGGGEGEAEQRFILMILSGAPGGIAGHVRSTGGEAIPGVRIRLFDVSQGLFVLRTHTDSAGNYAFGVVNPSTYLVRANTEGELFESQWFDGARRMEDATPVVVVGHATDSVNFTLTREDTVRDRFNVSGVVLDSASSPIGGARVSAFRDDHDTLGHDQFDDDHGGDRGGDHGGDLESSRTTLTDSSGRYHFLLRGGSYIFGASAAGFTTQFWDHKNSPLEADRLNLVQDTSGIGFTLSHRVHGAGSISGVIRSAADSTGLESHVLGFQEDSTGHATGFVASTRSNSSGAYTLEGLPNGSYIVLAKADHDFIPTFYTPAGGTPFLDSAAAVSVAGSAVTGIDIFTQPDSVEGLNELSGEVEHDAPHGSAVPSSLVPVSGALVTVSTATRQVAGYGITGTGGTYTVFGLAPGSYSVAFQKPGLVSVTVPASVSYVNNLPSTVAVNAQLANASGSGTFTAMTMRSDWNLLSLPMTVADARPQAVFPGAASPAFQFIAGGGYQGASQLEYGAGYWVRFTSAQALTIQGAQRTSETISLNQGWNLIGMVSAPVPTAALTTEPAGIISSRLFGYDAGYAAAVNLEPGKGYWVKAAAAGTVTLNAAPSPKTLASGSAAPVGLNTLTVSDANGHAQVLYFGEPGPGLDEAAFILPPSPPENGFDARFAGSKQMVLMPAASARGPLDYPVSVQGTQGALTIKWSVHTSGRTYTLRLQNGSGAVERTLSGTGTMRMASANGASIVLSAQGGSVPKEFSLGQNYPNPFNPTTRIAFDLPSTASVTLSVYNVIGQEVGKLIANQTMDAGAHSVSFSGEGLSSGIYFYRLQATAGHNGSPSPGGSFVSVRKMMLVR